MKKRKESEEAPQQGEPNDPREEARAGDANALGEDKAATLERERDEYIELARRARADYVNLQRRTENQSRTIREAATNDFALEVLDILDDLELALDHVREEHKAGAFAEGLELVRAKFLATLARFGIEPIGALGTPFDHNLHEAVAQQPTDEAEPGAVYAVLRKGYVSAGKLLRPARVVVAAPLPEAGDED